MAYKKNFQQQQDEGFKIFVKSVERALNRLKTDDDELFLKRQKVLFDRMIKLEKEFKRTLIKDRRGPSVFKAFIDYICDEQANLLSARPFFRSRQQTFTKKIANVLRARDPKKLSQFVFNYKFESFVMGLKRWGKKSKLTKIFDEITKTRQELILILIPLALNRSRIFFSRTPHGSHLTYSDYLGIAIEGIQSALDKFVGKFSKSVRGVAIGRMVGNFISETNQNLIHFWPRDFRAIYRIRKFSNKNLNLEDFKKQVNRDIDKKHAFSHEEIDNLMAASSGMVSADTPVQDQEQDGTNHIVTVVDRFQAPEETRPDVMAEQKDLTIALECAMDKGLNLREKKVLKMKGVGNSL